MKRSAEIIIILLVNFYFKYNQVKLYLELHDMTAFQTPLELL